MKEDVFLLHGKPVTLKEMQQLSPHNLSISTLWRRIKVLGMSPEESISKEKSKRSDPRAKRVKKQVDYTYNRRDYDIDWTTPVSEKLTAAQRQTMKELKEEGDKYEKLKQRWESKR